MANGYNQYKSLQVATSSREDLVAMLYDGARRFTDLARVALQAKQYEQVAVNVGKAQRILTELSVTLNFEVGGEMARNLEKLYEYWSWRLGQGLMHKDGKCFDEVSAVLSDMHEVWVEAAKQVKASRAAVAHG
ncbi:MAG TPA: flagellar export chaperone FliS [Symbiobacteriaceae bacterium]|nr:flagellar export chaperone FliS [Symbiobacteriaceae bacterium]